MLIKKNNEYGNIFSNKNLKKFKNNNFVSCKINGSNVEFI